MKDIVPSMIHTGKTALCAGILLLLPHLASAEMTAQSPHRFLEDIYAHYTSGKSNFEPLGKDGELLFEHGLFLLIQHDALNSNAKNEVPLLNGDPICNCQEYSKLKNLKITAEDTGNPHPMATVSFTNDGKKESLQYELVPSGDTWKIYDITSSDIGSLRDYLEKGEAEESQSKN